eukprot:732995-Ditylum_brightwellii.AAC.1
MLTTLYHCSDVPHTCAVCWDLSTRSILKGNGLGMVKIGAIDPQISQFKDRLPTETPSPSGEYVK